MDGPAFAGPRSAPLLDGRAPWTGFQEPGDVVLTAGRGLLDLGNRIVQTLYERVPAQATHAMLVAAPGLYLDATPRLGVTLIPAEAYAFDGPRAQARLRRRLVAVYRHPGLAASRARSAELQQAILRLCGQPYNFRFFLKREQVPDGTAFCCELVVKVFRSIGLELVPGRRAAAVLPETLHRALPADGWRDVGALYRRGMATPCSAR